MKTYIVFFGNTKHSIWNNPNDAQHQVETLRNYGYKAVSFHVIDATCKKNGRYYV